MGGVWSGAPIRTWMIREIADEGYSPRVHVTDPPDVDAIEALGDEIATLAAHIHAVTQRFLELIARFDELRGWEAAGYRDCAQWLSVRTGLDRGSAQEKVRTARALCDLPLTRDAMAHGRLSFSKVRALTRGATPENEADLLELAEGVTTAQLEKIVRAMKKGSRPEESDWDRERHESRGLSVFPDDHGMYVVKGKLTPEVGALLMRALEAAGDALCREKPIPGALDPERARREGKQRRADAIGLLAERALNAGFETASDTPVSGSRGSRYQVTLHVDPETLSADAEPGRSDLEDGTRLSAESARRLACDTSVVRVEHAADGSVLDVGRKTRTISPALRRALEVRDQGCRFPGCGLRFTDAHHLKHWADGGETSLGNCLLLCRHHHRLVHEGGWSIGWDRERRPLFFDPRGGLHYEGRWRPPAIPEEPVDALIEQNRTMGIDPDAWTASARWERERDIPERVVWRAAEALD